MANVNARIAPKEPLEFDDAFVTSLIRYGDSDCIARLFCKERGRIAAFARRGLAPSKKYGTVLQAPALATVALQSRKQSELAGLVRFDLSPLTFHIAAPRMLGLAAYLMEVVELFLPEQEPVPSIFDDLKIVFAGLSKSDHQRNALFRAFELRLLDQCGYLPDLTHHVLLDGPVCAYDPIESRLVSSPNAHSLEFGEEARALAMALLDAPLSALPDCDNDALRVVGRIFASRLRLMNKGTLKSVAFLRTLEMKTPC
jgi:recombinational DNA repair protein (RecF pathway)